MIDGKLSNHNSESQARHSFINALTCVTLTARLKKEQRVKKKLGRRNREKWREKRGRERDWRMRWVRKGKKQREHRQDLQKINRVSCFKGEGDTQAFHCSSQLSEANNNSRWIQQGQRTSEWEVESCRTDDEIWERRRMRRRRGQTTTLLKPHTPDVDRDCTQTQTFTTTRQNTRWFEAKYFQWKAQQHINLFYYLMIQLLLLYLTLCVCNIFFTENTREGKNAIRIWSWFKLAFHT